MPNPVTLDSPNPLVTSGGVGSSTGYSALDLRRLAVGASLQEGVVDAGDLKVTPGTGLNLQVATGNAFVQGDSVANQGLYGVYVGTAITDLTVPAADVTNPRLDQAVLEIRDDAHDASGLNLARLRVVTGTPTAGATLDNRNGAAPLPVSACRLADVLVPAAPFAGPFVAATHLRDRRPWARGAFYRARGTNAGNYSTVSGSSVAVDSTNLSVRIECSGVPVELSLACTLTAVTDAVDGEVEWVQDGAALSPSRQRTGLLAAGEQIVLAKYEFTPVSGSHVFLPHWFVSAGTGTFSMLNSGTYVPQMQVREVVRQNASNV